jgi:hypothetical protein
MNIRESVTSFVLRLIALALAIACIVLGLLETASIETLSVLLGVGLVAVALAGISRSSTA